MDVPGMHDTDRYELVKDIGSRNFGVARLMRDKKTRELVAVKYTERGEKIDENVEREIINHRTLRHPNIVRFKEEICHRDLKLENALLDGSPVPRLKICDFGYSKSLLHSQPKSRVGTPAYIAPEVLSKTEYDGKIADVWSCSVTLYVMLVGAYPFEDPEDPNNFRKTIERILNVQYTVPDNIQICAEGQNLLSHIFVANPARRITIPDIMKHEWFLKDLPADIKEGADMGNELDDPNHPPQNLEEIMRIIQEARIPPANTGLGLGHYLDDAGLDLDYMDNDADVDVDSSGEFVCAV